mmetsp:Transcript_36214/g.104163  ORF Transcript_36214/g.104163 Transcript_36214/m.104163 type:complete len:174 (-) Transcript_36214:253-774(-)
MGGCESCASSRRKDVGSFLREAVAQGDLSDLRQAIEKADGCGLDSSTARRRFAELAKQERQSPESAEDMLRWGMNTQDGVVLCSVIEEVSAYAPDHELLPSARARLREHHQEVKHRLRKLVRNRDLRSLGVTVDRARRMGMPPVALEEAERLLQREVSSKFLPPSPGGVAAAI